MYLGWGHGGMGFSKSMSHLIGEEKFILFDRKRSLLQIMHGFKVYRFSIVSLPEVVGSELN